MSEDIDRERLELAVRSALIESRRNYDVDVLISNSIVEDGVIIVRGEGLELTFDFNTYIPLGGAGC